MSDKIDLQALWDISYGLYIITAADGKKLNGQIANTVIQVTLFPPQVAVSIHKDNLTHQYIQKSKMFGVSVLEQDTSMKFIGTWGFKSGREINKFENIEYVLTDQNVPLVKDYALSLLETKLVKEVDVGTHSVFIGEIISSRIIKKGDALTYDYYQKVHKGKASKNAPTFKGNQVVNITNQNFEKQYICDVCGYIYDPEKGDTKQNVSVGTLFDDIPEDWLCPICGVGKDKFSKR